MKKSALTLKIFLAIVLNDMGDSIAQLFMKKGLTETGITSVHLNNILEFLSRNASSGLVWLGIVIYALGFFIWIIILSRIDLSIAMPVGSTSYVAIPILALIFLNEKISALRWIGILLIVAGIHFVSKSTHSVSERTSS